MIIFLGMCFMVMHICVSYKIPNTGLLTPNRYPFREMVNKAMRRKLYVYFVRTELVKRETPKNELRKWIMAAIFLWPFWLQKKYIHMGLTPSTKENGVLWRMQLIYRWLAYSYL